MPAMFERGGITGARPAACQAKKAGKQWPAPTHTGTPRSPAPRPSPAARCCTAWPRSFHQRMWSIAVPLADFGYLAQGRASHEWTCSPGDLRPTAWPTREPVNHSIMMMIPMSNSCPVRAACFVCAALDFRAAERFSCQLGRLSFACWKCTAGLLAGVPQKVVLFHNSSRTCCSQPAQSRTTSLQQHGDCKSTKSGRRCVFLCLEWQYPRECTQVQCELAI